MIHVRGARAVVLYGVVSLPEVNLKWRLEITSVSCPSKRLAVENVPGGRRAGSRRESRSSGNTTSVAETSKSGSPSPAEPEIDHTLEDGTARITVRGELTEAARRPLVRCMTDLLLGHQPLDRAELHLADVSFMNSAGMAVLVQLQKMADPRRVAVALVAPPVAVARPLQLTGLWHRFELVDVPEGLHPETGGA
jgi:anti-anti-sigma factor